MKADRMANIAILTMATAIGAFAFLYPLVFPGTASGIAGLAHAQDASWTTLALTMLCVVAVISNLTARQMSARTVAVLGVLTAVNAVLRALPGPGGFSGIFFLLALGGYVYGSTFGFLMGTLSLLVSALIGGGVGPWLPFQMFATGWMGLTSGWLPDLRRWQRLELAVLAGWVVLWGFVFGAVMNLWFWPYISPATSAAGQTWEAGLGWRDALRRYTLFYAATSAWWDSWRAAGNAALVLFIGAPLLKVLRRFEHVLGFEVY
jgi:energy-coupling factor transport system substrate-specific component